MIIQVYRLACNRRISAKPVSPQMFTQNDDAVPAWAVFLGPKCSPQYRLYIQDREQVRTNSGGLDSLGFSRARQVHLDGAEPRGLGKHSILRLIFQQFSARNRIERESQLGQRFLNQHES